MVNYQYGRIYKITCSSTNKVYVGSTTQPLSKRLARHVEDYQLWKAGVKKSYMTSFEILEGGTYRIELIEYFPCTTVEELRAREGKHIREIDCVNKTVPGRTRKEYRQDNKEKIREYCEKNKERIKERAKKYFEENKEKCREQRRNICKTFRENHQEKVECPCGSVVVGYNIFKHLRTKKHRMFLEGQEKSG